MLGFALTALFYIPPFWATVVLMIPLVVDGFTQKLTRYESTNPRRLLTGMLFGYGFAAALTIPLIHGFRLGYSLGRTWR